MTAYTVKQKQEFAQNLQRELDLLYTRYAVNVWGGGRGVRNELRHWSGYYIKQQKLNPIIEYIMRPLYFEKLYGLAKEYSPRNAVDVEPYYQNYDFDGPIWKRLQSRKKIWDQELNDLISDLCDAVVYAPGNQLYSEARSHFETLAAKK